MLRVPGSRRTCSASRARGGDVRIVYSPLDAVKLAAGSTRTSRSCSSRSASRRPRPPTRWPSCRRTGVGLTNFSRARLARARAAGDRGDPGLARSNRVQGFLAAGHVCTVMGTGRVRAARRASTGCRSWSPASSRSTCSRGSAGCVVQLEEGRAEVENAYARAVQPGGQRRRAGRASRDVFERVRPRLARHRRDPVVSGWRLARCLRRLRRRAALRRRRHPRRGVAAVPKRRGAAGPDQAERVCRPSATSARRAVRWARTMVSSEGACAAYYQYRRHRHRGDRMTDSRRGHPRRPRELVLPAAAARLPDAS